MTGISMIYKTVRSLFTRSYRYYRYFVTIRYYLESEGCSFNSRRFSFQQYRLFIEIADLPQVPCTISITAENIEYLTGSIKLRYLCHLAASIGYQ